MSSTFLDFLGISKSGEGYHKNFLFCQNTSIYLIRSSSNFLTFPKGVLGKSFLNSTSFGTL